MTLQLKFIPYLIKDGHEEIAYDSDLKLDEANEMAKNLISFYIGKIYEYKPFKFVNDLIEVRCGKGKYLKDMDEDEMREELEGLFGNSQVWIGEWAADTWLEGNMRLFDDREYGPLEFGIALYSLDVMDAKNPAKSVRKTRPSPSESAKSYPLGSIVEGNDGQDWINKQVKGGSVRWVRV